MIAHIQPLIHWSHGHKNQDLNWIKSKYIVSFIGKKKLFLMLN